MLSVLVASHVAVKWSAKAQNTKNMDGQSLHRGTPLQGSPRPKQRSTREGLDDDENNMLRAFIGRRRQQ